MDLILLKNHSIAVRNEIIDIVKDLDEEALSWQPKDDVWPIKQHLGDLAWADGYWIDEVVLRGTGIGNFEQNLPDLRGILDQMSQQFEKRIKIIGSITPNRLKEIYETDFCGKRTRVTLGWILIHLLEHDINHRAHIAMTLRLMGRPTAWLFWNPH